MANGTIPFVLSFGVLLVHLFWREPLGSPFAGTPLIEGRCGVILSEALTSFASDRHTSPIVP